MLGVIDLDTDVRDHGDNSDASISTNLLSLIAMTVPPPMVLGDSQGIVDALGSMNYTYDARANVIQQRRGLNLVPWLGIGSYSTSIAYSYDLNKCKLYDPTQLISKEGV